MIAELPARVAKGKRNIYQSGRRDLVAAGTHMVATATTVQTRQDIRDRAIVLVRVGLRPGDNLDVLEALGLVRPEAPAHGRSDVPGWCVCGWKSKSYMALDRGLMAHVTREARR
ncbi:MAG: hypothetical protein JWP85_2083 [Rhodoglobus sp.]|nr:hypothetical protein [Rhodoglobus sp.]